MRELIPFTIHRKAPYLRVSDKHQKEAAQELRLRQYYKEKRWEWPPAEHVYREKVSAFGGDGYSKRLEFQRAINDIRGGKLGGIVVLRVNRYFRKTRKALEIYDDLFALGAELIIAEDDYNALTQESYPRFLRDIADAEDFSLRHSRRIMDGKAAKYERGESNAPRMPRGAKRKGSVITWTKRAIPVRRAIDLLLTEQYSVSDIARAVSTEQEQFTFSQVYRWLRNPFYYGYIRLVRPSFGKRVPTAQQVRDAPLKRGKHKPLAAPRKYQQVQDILRKRGDSGSGQHFKNAYVFGVAVCAQCGTRLYGTFKRSGDGKKRKGYWCGDYSKTRACASRANTVAESVLDNQIDAILSRVKPPADWVARSLEQASTNEIAPAQAAELSQVKAQREHLAREFGARRITIEQLAVQSGQLDEREKSAVLPKREFTRSRMEAVSRALTDFPAMWRVASPVQKRLLMSLLFAEVRVDVPLKRISHLRTHEYASLAFRGAAGLSEIETGLFRVDIAMPLPRSTRRVVQVLRESGDATMREIAVRAGVSFQAVKSAMAVAEKGGEVQRVGYDSPKAKGRSGTPAIIWRAVGK